MTVRRICCALSALAALAIGPSSALASSSDAATTQAYLQANYAFMRYFTAHIPAAKAEIAGVLAQVRHECPRAAAESPENVDSEQLSNEVIGAMVTTVTQRNLTPILSFNRTVASLSWSNGALDRTVKRYVGDGKVLTSLSIPNVCADVKAWVASDYKTLPASTVRFDGLFMPAWVAPGDQPHALAAYETPQDRALAKRTTRLEEKWTEFEAEEVEAWGHIMDTLVLQP
jgi:hypothetical protein